MARVTKTITQARRERILKEYAKTDSDPANEGASGAQKCRAVARVVGVAPETVRRIVKRNAL